MKTLKYNFLFCVLTFFSSCSLIKPDIKEINTIQEVQTVFDSATKDDLFVFDVDEVLLESKDIDAQARFHKNAELKKVHEDLVNFAKSKNYSDAYMDQCSSKILLKAQVQPIEKKLTGNILDLQKRGIKVIALTHCNTGKFGLIERFEVWRYKQLLSLGLDFDNSFAQQEIVFNELQKIKLAIKYKPKNGGKPNPAVFYNGILFTSGYHKGGILKAFLEKINFRPTRIYFFDDKLENAESVTQEMKTMGIKCQAFVYKAATVNRSEKDLDIEVVKLEHELMKQRDDYVSYSEAKEILEQQKSLGKKQAQPIQQTP